MSARLSPDDAARLHMDTRGNPMTITAALRLDGPVALDALAHRLRARLVTRPRFADRVVEGTLSAPAWVPDEAFDLRAHLHHVALPAPCDDGALAELLGDLASTPLDPRLPLWQCHLVDDVGGGCAVVFRVHHAVVDGVGLVELLLALTDEGAGAWTPPSLAPPTSRSRLAAALAPVAGLAALLASPREPPGVLRAHPSPRKHLAWTSALPLDGLRAAARRRGHGLTALTLALTAGALRAVLAARGEVAPVRAMVPFSVRAAAEAGAMGNRFASVFVPLPVAERDPTARLDAAARALHAARVTSSMSLGRHLVSLAGAAGRGVERLGVALLSRRASVVVSNVPGPREAHRVLGRGLRDVLGFAPASGEVGLGVTFFGYAGGLVAGVSSGLADPSLAREVAEGVAREARALSG